MTPPLALGFTPPAQRMSALYSDYQNTTRTRLQHREMFVLAHQRESGADELCAGINMVQRVDQQSFHCCLFFLMSAAAMPRPERCINFITKAVLRPYWKLACGSLLRLRTRLCSL